MSFHAKLYIYTTNNYRNIDLHQAIQTVYLLNIFTLDNTRFTYLYGGAGVFGMITKDLDIYFLLGLLNSNVIQFCLHSIATKKQYGYYSYLNSFLETIPIKSTNSEAAKEISKVTKKIVSPQTEDNVFSLEGLLNNLVYKLY